MSLKLFKFFYSAHDKSNKLLTISDLRMLKFIYNTDIQYLRWILRSIYPGRIPVLFTKKQN